MPPLLERSVVLEPGAFLELNALFPAGAHLDATFVSDGPLDWNIHSHPPEGLKIHRSGRSSHDGVHFIPPAAGTYSLMFQNERSLQPVRLHLEVQLHGAAKVLSWVP
jgi:hypothetical protein